MRGSHTAGALWALVTHGITEFDVVCATSAGACTVAYFVARQFHLFDKVWQKYLHSGHFIRFQNLFTNRPVMDLDYLLDHVFREKEPLDTEAIRRSPTLFYITATDCETGKTHYFNNREHPILPALKATAALPLVYRNAVVIDGRRYMDGGLTDPIPVQKAIDAGCDEIWVLLTRPPGYRKSPPLVPLVPKFYEQSHPVLAKVIAAQHETYNEALARVERAELPCRLRVIRPEVKLPISRLTANRERILRALQQGYKDALLQLDLTHPLKDDKLL